MEGVSHIVARCIKNHSPIWKIDQLVIIFLNLGQNMPKLHIYHIIYQDKAFKGYFFTSNIIMFFFYLQAKEDFYLMLF